MSFSSDYYSVCNMQIFSYCATLWSHLIYTFFSLYLFTMFYSSMSEREVFCPECRKRLMPSKMESDFEIRRHWCKWRRGSPNTHTMLSDRYRWLKNTLIRPVWIVLVLMSQMTQCLFTRHWSFNTCSMLVCGTITVRAHCPQLYPSATCKRGA